MNGISNNLNSIQSALSMVILKKAMNADAQTMATLINDMMPQTPSIDGKGLHIDVRA